MGNCVTIFKLQLLIYIKETLCSTRKQNILRLTIKATNNNIVDKNGFKNHIHEAEQPSKTESSHSTFAPCLLWFLSKLSEIEMQMFMYSFLLYVPTNSNSDIP